MRTIAQLEAEKSQLLRRLDSASESEPALSADDRPARNEDTSLSDAHEEIERLKSALSTSQETSKLLLEEKASVLRQLDYLREATLNRGNDASAAAVPDNMNERALRVAAERELAKLREVLEHPSVTPAVAELQQKLHATQRLFEEEHAK